MHWTVIPKASRLLNTALEVVRVLRQPGEVYFELLVPPSCAGAANLCRYLQMSKSSIHRDTARDISRCCCGTNSFLRKALKMINMSDDLRVFQIIPSALSLSCRRLRSSRASSTLVISSLRCRHSSTTSSPVKSAAVTAVAVIVSFLCHCHLSVLPAHCQREIFTADASRRNASTVGCLPSWITVFTFVCALFKRSYRNSRCS